MTPSSTLATPEPTASNTNRSLPDPEVLERASRRRFTAADTLRILQETDAAKESKQVGALLRLLRPALLPPGRLAPLAD